MLPIKTTFHVISKTAIRNRFKYLFDFSIYKIMMNNRIIVKNIISFYHELQVVQAHYQRGRRHRYSTSGTTTKRQSSQTPVRRNRVWNYWTSKTKTIFRAKILQPVFTEDLVSLQFYLCHLQANLTTFHRQALLGL